MVLRRGGCRRTRSHLLDCSSYRRSARALVRQPKLLLLDEPFEGLAPIIVRDLLATCRALAEAGQTILVVEQNVSAAMNLASRLYVINNGHIVEEMTAQSARNEREWVNRHLGV